MKHSLYRAVLGMFLYSGILAKSMYRSFFALFAACIALFGMGSVSSAQAFVPPGEPDGFVNDYADVLSPGVEEGLEAQLMEFERNTRQEIAVVTISHLETETIESYSTKLFEAWGIGKVGLDNGVLVLIAVQDKKFRIEVGYGVEGVLTDVRSGQIMRSATPLLQGNKPEEAIVQMADQVMKILETNEDIPMQRPSSNPWVLLALVIGMFAPFILIAYFFIRSRNRLGKERKKNFDKAWKEMNEKFEQAERMGVRVSRSSQTSASPSRSSLGGSRGSSSSRSSSRNSFGGGRSGGGGASGSW